MLAGFVYSLRFHGWSRVFVVGAGVVLAVGVFAWISFSRQRMKLTMIDGRLVFTGFARDRVVLAEGRTGRVVDVQVDWGRASGRKSRFWLLIDTAGRAVVSLNRDAWDDGELEVLRERLGLPIEIVETPKRPVELRKAYPGTIPWWGAHPVIATVLAIVIIAALSFAL
jgi:hypothetical protein